MTLHCVAVLSLLSDVCSVIKEMYHMAIYVPWCNLNGNSKGSGSFGGAQEQNTSFFE